MTLKKIPQCFTAKTQLEGEGMNDEELMRRATAWWRYHTRVCTLKRWLRELQNETLSLEVSEILDYEIDESIEALEHSIKDAYNEAEIASQRLFNSSYYEMKTFYPLR